MAEKTIFSRIIEEEIPAEFVYRNEHVVAIRDINPAAPIHILVIPRKAIPSLAQLADSDLELAGRLLVAARTIAEQEGIAEAGYRVVINTGEQGGQSVPHLHLHLLGGKHFSEASLRG